MAFSRPPNRDILQKIFGNNSDMIRQYENLFINTDTLTNEIDRIENSVGLYEDGNYIQPSGTNYIDNTSSVMGALIVLDNLIKPNFSYDVIAQELTIPSNQQMIVKNSIKIDSILQVKGKLFLI